MSRYVLDTDILSLYQLCDPIVGSRVMQHRAQELAVSIISVEPVYGACRAATISLAFTPGNAVTLYATRGWLTGLRTPSA